MRVLAVRALAVVGRLYTILAGKSDLAGSTEIAPNVYLSDKGNLVIGARRIGSGTVIHERVTIGRSLTDNKKPLVGNNVWVGPDCTIYGGIEIGDGATLLPGTVLTKTVPALAVLRGNPARLVARNFDNISLRASVASVHRLLSGEIEIP
ncbi:MAG: hypothetical protein ABI859_03075 [Pseudomonadota bacterium]